jgi:hypothetical protein
MWFAGDATDGACPGGGAHIQDSDSNYSLVADSAIAPGQAGWRRCEKCLVLWFSGNPSQGWCAAGGEHIAAAGANYTLPATGSSEGEQFGWRRCSRCEALCLERNGKAGACPAGGTHDLSGSTNLRVVGVNSTIRLHTKVLTAPDVDIETMLHNMRDVYSVGAFDVEWLSNETLSASELEDLDVGECVLGMTTAEQNELFDNRNNVAADEVVVYFVRSTVPPYNGCAAHPIGRPGAVVAQGASPWTLAHEVGHVLGLTHIDDNDRLMTGNGTANITNPPPDLISSEIATMDSSGLTIDA